MTGHPPPDLSSHTMVIFGASGDLTRRKLIPALYQLFQKGRLPIPTRIVGMARRDYSSEHWRRDLADAAAQFVGKNFESESWSRFCENVFYLRGDATNSADITSLANRLRNLEGETPATRVYYFATAPSLYAPTIAELGAANMADETEGERRVVIEKPFGVDLPSARQLNEAAHRVFQEQQIYRIDHYLGKETVQNLLVLRFGNTVFEPVWSRNYIDHVQITVAEEVDVGRRAAYYDSAGVLRDMFQNHLLQLLTITAMEAPVRYEANLIRDEKVKVLRAIRSMSPAEIACSTVRGRYAGYLQEEGAPPDSSTATFAAIRLGIENWRWGGAPFYLRSGKAMSCRTTQIVIQFRQPPHTLFENSKFENSDGPLRSPDLMQANRLVIQIQPAEGIQLHLQTKTPDAGMKVRTTPLDFRFSREFSGSLPDAYQRLLLDALKGDASLFARSDEVELAWSIIDPLHAAWRSEQAPPLEEYPRGQWGPASSTKWMQDQGREWFDVCPVLH